MPRFGHQRAARAFSRSFDKLPAQQAPFAQRLRAQKIHSLSARYAHTICAAEIEADLRVVFYIEGGIVVTVDIGSRDLYQG